MTGLSKIKVGVGEYLTIHQIEKIVRGGATVSLSEKSPGHIKEAQESLMKALEKRTPVYGVNTQFGRDSHKISIPTGAQEYLSILRERQANLIRSHNCGLGESIPEEISRTVLLLRAHTLAKGYSGVRKEICDFLIKLLNSKAHPVMYRYGSVGASGDLIPLASIGAVLLGNGNVYLKDKEVKSSIALKRLGLRPLILEAKEGLSLVNGTSFSSAIASLAILDLCRLLPLSIAVSAAAFEAMLGMHDSFRREIHQLKNHPGQIKIAELLRRFLKGSRLIRTLSAVGRGVGQKVLRGETNFELIQDYYSLRAIPQGFGPFYENLETAVKTIEREINSINDNPIMGKNGAVYQGANFMTDYITATCDMLRSDVARASTWLHALLSNLIDDRKNRGLPDNLIANGDMNNGIKATQILACALATHNRQRAAPYTMTMLPTEKGNQDMVGLGAHAALDLKEVTENFAKLITIMLVATSQALEIRGVRNAGHYSQKLWRFTRRYSKFLNKDRQLHSDLITIETAIKNTKLVDRLFVK